MKRIVKERYEEKRSREQIKIIIRMEMKRTDKEKIKR